MREFGRGEEARTPTRAIIHDGEWIWHRFTKNNIGLLSESTWSSGFTNKRVARRRWRKKRWKEMIRKKRNSNRALWIRFNRGKNNNTNNSFKNDEEDLSAAMKSMHDDTDEMRSNGSGFVWQQKKFCFFLHLYLFWLLKIFFVQQLINSFLFFFYHSLGASHLVSQSESCESFSTVCASPKWICINLVVRVNIATLCGIRIGSVLIWKSRLNIYVHVQWL